jgi:hypothetical protein
MQIYKRFFVIVALVCFSTMGSVEAQVDLAEVGQSTMTFLEVGVSPKAVGMGNAYTTVGDGVQSVFYNPAGLAANSGYNLFVSHTRWIADINYIAGAVSRSLGSFGVVGVNVLTVDYGDIERTLLLGQADPEGFERAGNVDIGAYAIGLSYARQISTQFSMGGQVQFVGQQLGSTQFDTGEQTNRLVKPTLNFGVRYDTGYKGFAFGMSMRNFATSAEYEEVSAQLPLLFSAGISLDMMEVINPDSDGGSSLIVSSEFLHPNNFSERVNVGGEYSALNGLIALRGGYQFNRDVAGLTGGFGLAPDVSGVNLAIDYSYSEMAVFSGVHRFGFDVTF